MKIKKVNKSNFYKNKKLFNIHDLDADKVLVSKKDSCGTKNSLKYFIGYNDDDVLRPLSIKLPQIIGYVKYKKIWKKISNLMNIEFDSDPVYGDNDKYINTKKNVWG